MTEAILIKGVRILDPGDGHDAVGDILIDGTTGLIISRGPAVEREGATVINGAGLIASPGFIDLHTHLREPGNEDKETIASGTAAAARGGFTTLVAMPNTTPAIDNAVVVEFVAARAREAGPVRVLMAGAVTRGRQGKALTDMEELAKAGVIGFTDDGSPVADGHLMQMALLYAGQLGLPVIDHCEDFTITRGIGVHDGWVASRLGLQGYPSAAEDSLVARDIALAEMTGGHFHAAHLSTAGGVELVRHARAQGLRVTAEVTPHHLTMSEEWVMGPGASANGNAPPLALTPRAYDAHAKVSPPLRAVSDRAALVHALVEGTIDAIATDHAPHTFADKTVPFEAAAVGISELETAFASLMSLVHAGEVPLATLIARLTTGPAAVLGPRHAGLATLRAGTPADVVLFDPNEQWTVDVRQFASKGRNTPLDGAVLRGRVKLTIAQGRVVFNALPASNGGKRGRAHA